MDLLKIHPDCTHQDTSNCRRNGCNCLCGNSHGHWEQDEIQEDTTSMEEKLEALEKLIDVVPSDMLRYLPKRETLKS